MAEPRYLTIIASVEAEFQRNRELHGERIRCRAGCSDCCSQLFRISGLEAAHIAEGMRQVDPELRDRLRERATEYLAALPGLPPAGARLPCPALVDGLCSIYEFRPLICRRFGMPIFNPDKPDRIFACELNFRDGEEIEDPHLIRIQTGIHEHWKQLKSEHAAGGEAHCVATALLQDVNC